MDSWYISILLLIIIVACQIQQSTVQEEFGVMKRSYRHVKKSVRYGVFVIKNSMGMFKDFMTFNWI
jgi:hypothetical protein